MQVAGMFRHVTDLVDFKAGETVFRQGDAGDRMYVVREGEVDIQVADEVLETVAAGGMLGEMALIDDSPRSATAIVRADAKLAPVDQKLFTFLVQQTPYFAVQVMKTMADRLRRMDRKT